MRKFSAPCCAGPWNSWSAAALVRFVPFRSKLGFRESCCFQKKYQLDQFRSMSPMAIRWSNSVNFPSYSHEHNGMMLEMRGEQMPRISPYQSKINVFGLRVVFVVENLCNSSRYNRYNPVDTTQSPTGLMTFTEKGEPPQK